MTCVNLTKRPIFAEICCYSAKSGAFTIEKMDSGIDADLSRR